MSFRTDLPFAMVPVWVLELPISDKALRLYGVLAGMADYSTGQTLVKRKTLAEKIGGVSVDSVDRAKAELIEHGAISMEHRERNDGGNMANVYVVHRIPPGRRDAAPLPQASDEGGRTGAAPKNESTSSQSSSSRKRAGRAPTTIGGKRVSADEEAFAIEVLDVLNERASEHFGRTFRFASKEALGKVVLRHREHPDLTVEDHRGIIETQMAHPWWTGDPSPNVIYGNGDVFDRARNGVRGVRGGKDNTSDGTDAFAAYE